MGWKSYAQEKTLDVISSFAWPHLETSPLSSKGERGKRGIQPDHQQPQAYAARAANHQGSNTAGRNKKNKLVWKSSTPNRILPTWKPICQAGILLATQAVYVFFSVT